MANEKDIIDLLEAGDLPEGPPAAAEHDYADTHSAGRGHEELDAGGYDVGAINQDHALVLLGSKSVIVKQQRSGPIEDRFRILNIDAFDHWFSNKFTEVRCADGKPRNMSWGRAWRTDGRRRQYSGVEFFPNPDGAEATPGYLNLWQGFAVKASQAGSWKIFRDHLLNNVCRGDATLFDWVFGFFARIVQRPRERIGTALVLRGSMGSGKSKVGEVFGSLFPEHYCQVDDERYVTGHFNAHMARCILLQADEAVWAGDKRAEGRLKGLITSETQYVESKGVDALRLRNFVNVLFTTNEDWAIPAGPDERRFAVLDVDPRCAQNHDYFGEMQRELDSGGRERLLYELMHFDLSKVDLRKIPRTNALLEQKIRSFDQVVGWWFERLQDGVQTRNCGDWLGFVSSDALYSDFQKRCDEVGISRKREREPFFSKLKKLAPGCERTRPRGERGSRAYGYSFPSLAECRRMFDEMVGQEILWPTEVVSEGELPSTPADDEVPA